MIGCFVIAAMFIPEIAQAAGAGYAVDIAEVSSPGSCKVESWVSSADNGDLLAAVSPACVVNLTRPVEFSSQFSRSGSSGEWATAATPKIKTNLLPSGIGIWGLAITASAAYDLSTGENTAVSVVLPATLRLSEVMRVNLNAGWQQDRTLNRPYFVYGAAFDIRTLDNVWTVTGEMFG